MNRRESPLTGVTSSTVFRRKMSEADSPCARVTRLRKLRPARLVDACLRVSVDSCSDIELFLVRDPGAINVGEWDNNAMMDARDR